MLILLILGILALSGVVTTLLKVRGDGYTRVPDRPAAVRAFDLNVAERDRGLV